MSSQPTPLETVQPSVPTLLCRVIDLCLAKDPDERWQSARDVKQALNWIVEDSTSQTTRRSQTTGTRRRVALSLGIALTSLGLGILIGMLLHRGAGGAPPTVTRAVIAAPSRVELRIGFGGGFALSPDGKTVVFVGRTDGKNRLYVRPLDQLMAMPIPGTDGASTPFFSPDGRWVGFYDGRIKKVALSGGAPQVVCEANQFASGAWSDDNSILFVPTSASGLFRVSADGGTPQRLTVPDRGRHEKTHRYAEPLPGGRALLMTVGTADMTTFDDARIEVLTIATGERKTVIRGGTRPRYLNTGHIVYARAGSLVAVPFDVKRLEVTGAPVTLIEGVNTDPDIGSASFAVSRDGSLLYASGTGNTEPRSLLWADRQGNVEPVFDMKRRFMFPQVSPDGQRIAVTIDAATSEIWVYDAARTTSTRLVAGWDNFSPIWSPDGLRIAFNSNRGTSGGRNLFWQTVDGTSAPERLMPDTFVDQFPTAWSSDGRLLVFSQFASGTSGDLWLLSANDRKSTPLLTTTASEGDARISPDGRWLAYQSDQSGRFEVYVTTFPQPSRAWQVSLDGGRVPVWSRSGREVFYRRDSTMMTASIGTGAEFTSGKPTRLFEFPEWEDTRPQFDVAPDGRFLLVKSSDRPPTSQLTLVQNWFGEVKVRLASK